MTLENELGLIDEYTERFINRYDSWTRQWLTPDGELVYIPNTHNTDSPLLLDRNQIIKHLKNLQTIAIAANDENDCSKWGCWDLDVNDNRLSRIEEFLHEFGLSTVRTEPSSKNKGGHLFILLCQPVLVQSLHFFNRAVIDELNISSKDLEFYPKWNSRKKIVSKSHLRAPLGQHKKPEANGAIEYFIGPEHDLVKQLQWLAIQPLNEVNEIIQVSINKEQMILKEERELKEVLCINNNNKRTLGSNRDYQSIDWFSVIPSYDLKSWGNDYAAPCKLCQSLGHDRSGNNLRITLDGRKANCVSDGADSERIHTVAALYDFYLS